MHVGINVNPAAGTGIPRYGRNLLLALGTLVEAEPGLCLTAFSFGKRDPRPAWLPAPIGYRATRMPGRVQRLLHDRLRVPVERLFPVPGLHLMHTATMELLHTRLPCVMTIFDVAWRHVGPAYTSIVAADWIAQVEAMILRARHLCAISAATAADLVAGGIPPERVTVTPLGVEDRFRAVPPEAVARVRRRYDLPQPMLLYVGAVNVRKNVGVLVEALKNVQPAPTLILCGPPPAEGLDQWGLLRPGIRHLGYVPDDDLPALYAAAAALVFPSLVEGFGLPVLEAMAAGTPVIASDIPVFREIGGDSLAYFGTGDAEGLSRVIEQVLHDPALRARLTRSALDRSSAYTWSACARATARAYRAALGEG